MGGWLLIGPNTIGNDYPRVQPYGSQTLRFYTRHGIEPMWYPHLAGGVPIGFLPFAQYFHLPAWLSSELPGYWTGRRGDPRILQRADAWSARATLGGRLLAAALTMLAPHLSALANNALTPATLNSAWSPQLRLAWLGLGVMASFAPIVCRERRRLALILLGATVMQAGIVFHFGTWLERKRPAPTDRDFLSANHLPLYGTPPLRVDNEPFIGGFCGGTTQYVRFHQVRAQNVTRHLPVKRAASLEDIVLPFYLSIPNCARSELAADSRLAFEAAHTQSPHAATATRASCDSDVDPAPSGPLLAARLVELNENNAVRSLTPNRLAMTVLTSAPAILVTPFPWIRQNWQARMDNALVPVVSVNGGFRRCRRPTRSAPDRAQLLFARDGARVSGDRGNRCPLRFPHHTLCGLAQAPPCRRPPIGNCAVGTRPRGLPAMGADVREPRGGGFSAAEYLHTPTEETAGSMANSRAPRNHEYDCSASAAVSIAYIAAGPWRLHIDSVARSRLALELRRGSPTIQVRGVVVRRRATGYGLPRCPRSLLPRMG